MPRQAKNLHEDLPRSWDSPLSTSETLILCSIAPAHIFVNPDKRASLRPSIRRRSQAPRVRFDAMSSQGDARKS
jgi:hypothetical protein